MLRVSMLTVVLGAAVAALASLSFDVARADESPAPADASEVQESEGIHLETFAGLLYIKQGLVGTRSEGPVYYLQTPRADYQLQYTQRHPWERDKALEELSRQMVAVRGQLSGETIRVEQIERIDVPRLPRPPLEALVMGNSEFAWELFKQLSASDAQGERNLAISPHSISTALAMTHVGARGETATEMARVLGFAEVPPGLLHATQANLLRIVQQNPRANYFTIHAANRLWADQRLAPEILAPFREVIARDYDGGIETIDFAGNVSGARDTINHWVADHTSNKITELIPDGGVDAQTRLVLANALHFHGYWGSPFDVNATAPAPFHVSADQAIETPTMRQTAQLPYWEDDDKQVVALPVRGGMFSMVFVLPRGTRSLADVRAQMYGRSFLRTAASMEPRQIELYLPRFKSKAHFELGATLGGMGMPRAFSLRDADFSGINGKTNLYIDKVFHEAVVDVNEEGVEASAATAVAMRLKSGRPTPTTLVRIDRPFLFVLRDNRTGSLLFIGQLVNPQS